MAIGEDESVNLGLDVLALDPGKAHEASHVNLVVKVLQVGG